MSELLIVGVGNLLMGDDGVGPRVVERLGRETLPAGVSLVDAGLCGLGLLDIWRGYRQVWLVDAVAVADGCPGEVRWLPVEAIPRAGRIDAHGGLEAVLTLARELNQLPELLEILAVVPQRVAPGRTLSDVCARAVEAAVRMVLARLG
ncbi:MAG: HyaD/HybD family hydrogenase maturation endopeptidase [Geothermobacteraceae bacterium]